MFLRPKANKRMDLKKNKLILENILNLSTYVLTLFTKTLQCYSSRI